MQPDKKMWTRPWTSMTAVCRFLLTTVCAAILLTHRVAANAGSIEPVSGMLYAENFTYYKLSGEGWLRLELHSLQGDVDIYVSGLTLTPTFTNYELKSETCGMDTVDIHSSMNRPVGIGIYAHPFHMQSVFRMDIELVNEFEVDEYEQLFKTYHYYEEMDESVSEERRSKSPRKSKVSDSAEEEEESIWWTILITVLKFILEVIV